jgi:hypothetical protein
MRVLRLVRLPVECPECADVQKVLALVLAQPSFSPSRGGLTGRVGSPDHEDLLPRHGRGFDTRRTVGDTCPDEPLQSWNSDPAVGHAGRDYDRAGDHSLPSFSATTRSLPRAFSSVTRCVNTN